MLRRRGPGHQKVITERTISAEAKRSSTASATSRSYARPCRNCARPSHRPDLGERVGAMAVPAWLASARRLRIVCATATHCVFLFAWGRYRSEPDGTRPAEVARVGNDPSWRVTVTVTDRHVILVLLTAAPNLCGQTLLDDTKPNY